MIQETDKLIDSLKHFSAANNYSFTFEKNTKGTKSLYRHGFFLIDGERYGIVSWNYRKHIIVFENENSLEKIKYDMIQHTTVGKQFPKIVKQTLWNQFKLKLSDYLRILSERLQY